MTKWTIFAFLIIINFNSFADGGDYFRFKVKIELVDNSELVGYTYFVTYDSSFNSENEKFLEFVKRRFVFPISIYQSIKTITLESNQQFDFSSNNLCKKIQLSEIKDIQLIGVLKYPSGQRLVELSGKEYELANGNPTLNGFIYNSKISENCSYILFAWSNVKNFTEIRNGFENKVNELVDKKEYNEVNKYISKSKKELFEKGILIIQSCTEL